MICYSEKAEAYLIHNNFEITYERRLMLQILKEMEAFSSVEFIQACKKKNITIGTIYNFINLLIDAKILLPKVEMPVRFNDDENQIAERLTLPAREMTCHQSVRERILHSHKPQ